MSWLRSITRFFTEPSPHALSPKVEVMRVTSPDGKRDAVLAHEAPSSLGLYVVSSGDHLSEKFESRFDVFIHCTDPRGMRISWLDDRTLQVEGECDETAQEPGHTPLRKGEPRIYVAP